MREMKPPQSLELKFLTMNVKDSIKTFYATIQITLMVGISIIMLQENLSSKKNFRAEREKIQGFVLYNSHKSRTKTKEKKVKNQANCQYKTTFPTKKARPSKKQS
jgi:hypothetical protein